MNQVLRRAARAAIAVAADVGCRLLEHVDERVADGAPRLLRVRDSGEGPTPRGSDRFYDCPKCGPDLPAPNLMATVEICPGCRGAVPAGDAFCAHCGRGLGGVPAPAEPEEAVTSSTVLTPNALAPLRLVIEMLARLDAHELETVAQLCQERLGELRGKTP